MMAVHSLRMATVDCLFNHFVGGGGGFDGIRLLREERIYNVFMTCYDT